MTEYETTLYEFGDKAWQNECVLRDLYYERQHSLEQIGDILGCHENTVIHWMDKYGLDRRDRTNRSLEESPWRDRDKLYSLFYIQATPINDIANKLDSDRRTIVKWLEKHDISPDPWQTEESLRELYVNEGLPVGTIAELVGVDEDIVSNWVGKYELKYTDPWKNRGVLEAYSIDPEATLTQMEGDFDYSKSHIKDWLISYKISPPGSDLLYSERLWREEKILRDLYENKYKTIDEIADSLKCERTTIARWLKKFGVSMRSTRDYADMEPWTDSYVLRELYINQERTMGEIGDILGCSETAVLRGLERNGMETRDRGGYDSDADYRDKSVLREYYIERGYNITQTANKLGGSVANVWRWLVRYNLHDGDYGSHRVVSSIRRWLGDESWSEQAQRIISERGNKCEMCGLEPSTNERSVSAHHVIPIRAGGSNFDEGILLLCDSCHQSAEWYSKEYISFSIDKFIKEELCPQDKTSTNI